MILTLLSCERTRWVRNEAQTHKTSRQKVPQGEWCKEEAKEGCGGGKAYLETLKVVLDVGLGHIKREVADERSVRGSGRQGELLSGSCSEYQKGVSCTVRCV